MLFVLMSCIEHSSPRTSRAIRWHGCCRTQYQQQHLRHDPEATDTSAVQLSVRVLITTYVLWVGTLYKCRLYKPGCAADAFVWVEFS